MTWEQVVSRQETERLTQGAQRSPLDLYCMGSLLADEASRTGNIMFAQSIEQALNTLLGSMPREDQRTALRLSYELAVGGAEPAPPRLRLVYSRD